MEHSIHFNSQKEVKIMRTGKKKLVRSDVDAISFFFWHNIISMFLFFMCTMSFGFYGARDRSIAYIFSLDFLWFILLIFVCSMGAGLLGRLLAYILMKVYFDWRGKVMKKVGDLNRGINKISVAFFLSAFLTAVAFSLGVVIILQDKVFNQNSLLTLMGSYLLLKIGIYFAVKYLELYL